MNDEDYYQYIYDENYDSSLGEPIFKNNRYLTLYGNNINSFGLFKLYGRVDNLFLTYEISTNSGTNIYRAYLQGAYLASCTKSNDDKYRYLIIFDSISYHSKFEIESIKNHCINIKKKNHEK